MSAETPTTPRAITAYGIGTAMLSPPDFVSPKIKSPAPEESECWLVLHASTEPPYIVSVIGFYRDEKFWIIASDGSEVECGRYRVHVVGWRLANPADVAPFDREMITTRKVLGGGE